MNAQEWLADIEEKAGALQAHYGELRTPEYSEALENYLAATKPAAVKRLVKMVRVSAFNAARSRGLFTDPDYWIDTAYMQTKEAPCQKY